MSTSGSRRNIHGILLLDKRFGISSNKALQEVKRLYNANKAGHTGSLDPLATGLLPICFGAGTKISGLLLDENKRYHVTVQLGVTTDTGDLEGNVVATRSVPDLSKTDLELVLSQFIGAIEQVPPMYSALKHNGKKLYELARAGMVIDRKSRKVNIDELQLLSYESDWLELVVACSKGTYIRSLAEDIGNSMGCGATVKTLRRLQVGEFKIEQALTFEKLQQLDEIELMERLIAVDRPLHKLPSVVLDDLQTLRIQQGQSLPMDTEIFGSVRMYHFNEFLGLGEMALDGKLLPKKLFFLGG